MGQQTQLINLLIVWVIASCFGKASFIDPRLKSDIDFMAFTIKDAYAGYSEKVRNNNFDLLIKRVKQSRSKDTFALLSQLTLFFADNHLSLTDENIGEKIIDSLQCTRDKQMVEEYFANKKRKDKYEGYWLSEFNNCVIALKKVNANPITYHGYVMETNAKLPRGFCMLKMIQQKNGTYLTDYTDADFYFRIFLRARFKNLNTLWANSSDIFRRIIKYTPGILTNRKAISYKPKFTKIDSSTVVLTMPSFRSIYIKKIDSIIKANKPIVDSATTLILDIRNNGGGVIDNYFPLFPYIYTGPIWHAGGYTRYSHDYIQNYENRVKRYLAKGDTANAKVYADYLDSIRAKKGQFVYHEGDTLAKGLPILAKPKNVAILINNNCLSSAELMLLNFRQSSKVKFFGEPTGGAVDYLNIMNFVLPNKQYSLSVPYTKRAFSEREPRYDGIGIKPDVAISDDISDWIAFVKKYYDEHQ